MAEKTPKQIELLLAWYPLPLPGHYRVKAIDNSTHYKPGMDLPEEDVKELIRIGWNVKMIDNEVLQTILGFIGAHAIIPTRLP